MSNRKRADIGRKVSAVAILFLSACAARPLDSSDDSMFPSQVNKSAKQFDGTQVKLRGYLLLRYENIDIGDTKEGYKGSDNVSHCVALINNAWLYEQAKTYDGKYVEITGTYRRDAADGNIIRLTMCNKSALELDSSTPPRIVGKRR